MVYFLAELSMVVWAESQRAIAEHDKWREENDCIHMRPHSSPL